MTTAAVDHRAWIRLLLCTLLFGALIVPVLVPDAAQAATFTVNRTGDPPPDGCQPNECSLREAIIAANNRPGPDTIVLPAGRYELNRPTPGEDLSRQGDLDIEKPVTIRGAGRIDTVIDGNGHDRVLHILDDVDDVFISNLALVQGNMLGGAGIFNLGELTLRNTLLRNNVGGGINNQHRMRIVNSRVTGSEGRGIDNLGRMTIVNSRVDHNEFTCCGVGLATAVEARTTIIDSSIDHNTGSSCCGIGIYALQDSVIILKRTTVSENKSESSCCGAGIYLQDTATGRIRNSRITNNRLEVSCCGSGLYLQDNSSATVKGTLIRGNVQKGSGPGGAVYGEDFASIAIKSSTIAGNTSEAGGGGVHVKDFTQLVLVNSTISGNVGSEGGGIDEYSSGALTLKHVTITRNEADDLSSGIFTNGGAWAVLRSVVAGNSANDCSAALTGPTGKNLDSDSTCFNTGTPIHGAPGLGPLGRHGGKTPTHVPFQGSRAVDEVGGANCPHPGRDQRGVKRPQNGDGQPGKTCDLGAVERKPGE